ncbi:MAG TPA: HD domain-containing phosphohydrolase [Solirubrobacteraceae bacterium]
MNEHDRGTDVRDADGSRWLGRRRAGLTLHAALAAGLIPAELWLAPRSSWDAPVALLALAVMAVVVDRHDVPLPSGIRFDGLIAVSLITVALAGPIPALAVALTPMIVNGVSGHERLLRAGNLANLAAYGWYTLAGSVLLQLAVDDPASPSAVGWLVVAGVVMQLVNWAIGPAIYGPLWLGHPFRVFVDLLVDTIGAGMVMIALAAGCVLLVGPIGVLALIVFAAIAVLPGSFLTYAARSRPVARLDHAVATKQYALALAMHLKRSRRDRRHLARVIAASQSQSATGDPIDYIRATAVALRPVTMDAQLSTEWWNGNGTPIGLRGDAIPIAARILAVAETWSSLTARGSAQLGHHDVLERLKADAGKRFDPAIVRAAAAVVAQERVTSSAPAPAPDMHRLRVPAPLRRAIAGREGAL